VKPSPRGPNRHVRCAVAEGDSHIDRATPRCEVTGSDERIRSVIATTCTSQNASRSATEHAPRHPRDLPTRGLHENLERHTDLDSRKVETAAILRTERAETAMFIVRLRVRHGRALPPRTA